MLHKTKACFNYFRSFRMYWCKKYVSRTKLLYLNKFTMDHRVVGGEIVTRGCDSCQSFFCGAILGLPSVDFPTTSPWLLGLGATKIETPSGSFAEGPCFP